MRMQPARYGDVELVEFYLHGASDTAGRTFEQTLRLNDQELEQLHDYIQWIFPTFTRSDAVPEAPSLSTEAAISLRANLLTQSRAIAALVRMLKFYGLELDDDPEEPVIVRSDVEFARRRPVWMNPGNHNYRRLTRILTSLQILGCPQYSTALFDCLKLCFRDHGGLIGASTMEHWKRAVGVRTN